MAAMPGLHVAYSVVNSQLRICRFCTPAFPKIQTLWSAVSRTKYYYTYNALIPWACTSTVLLVGY